ALPLESAVMECPTPWYQSSTLAPGVTPVAWSVKFVETTTEETTTPPCMTVRSSGQFVGHPGFAAEAGLVAKTERPSTTVAAARKNLERIRLTSRFNRTKERPT